MNSDENDRALALTGYLVPPMVLLVWLTESGRRPFVRCHGAHALAHLVVSLLVWGGLAVLGSLALLVTYGVEGRLGVVAALLVFELGLVIAFVALWLAAGRQGGPAVPLLTAVAGGLVLAPFFAGGAVALGVLLLLACGVGVSGLVALWLGVQAFQGHAAEIAVVTPLLRRLGWC
ncbi:MAG: hypothetical protein HYY05_03375 [Chloroflexi bacterium]|nr:hypothetical protein [Chloroflexota bacterium]